MTVIRGFARFQAGFDARTEIPPTDLFARNPGQRQEPYLYSEHEIAELLHAARRMRHALRAATFESYIGLLAATGMRPGEGMRLDCHEADLRRGLLTVRDTKFGKSRLIPLHASAIEQLEGYRRDRDRLCPRSSSEAFFLSGAGTRLNYTNASTSFNELLARAGIWPGAEPKPRLYDLRHTFAVTTLASWYEQDLDVAHMLPTLSTYLGHVSPATTYWYLHACPVLMTAAAERLETSWSHA